MQSCGQKGQRLLLRRWSVWLPGIFDRVPLYTQQRAVWTQRAADRPTDTLGFSSQPVMCRNLDRLFVFIL